MRKGPRLSCILIMGRGRVLCSKPITITIGSHRGRQPRQVLLNSQNPEDDRDRILHVVVVFTLIEGQDGYIAVDLTRKYTACYLSLAQDICTSIVSCLTNERHRDLHT